MSDLSFGVSIGSFGSCSGADCDCDGCDCDGCDCGDCDCPDCDCDCDCCKNCCDEVCFKCCSAVYNGTVEGCSDYVCCCFFHTTTTTTTDGRQRSDSYDSYHDYEMYHRSDHTTHVPVPVTSPPDRATHEAGGAKGQKMRNGAQKDQKKKKDQEREEDEMSPEELEQRVMAGEENWQPENEELRQMADGDSHPTAPPIEVEAVTLERSDAYDTEHETTSVEVGQPEIGNPKASLDEEQATSLLDKEKVTAMKDDYRHHSTEPLTSPEGGSNLREEEVPMADQNEEDLRGYHAKIPVDTNYPVVDPPSYDDVVTTQPGSSGEVE